MRLSVVCYFKTDMSMMMVLISVVDSNLDATGQRAIITNSNCQG